MDLLSVLVVLQLLAVPAFTVVPPTHDYWGEFGAFGPCSRTCGTGVAMKTRKCITARSDGGHNCVGSSKSFRTCNTQACPAGSKNFREEQCAEFDRMPFQGKHRSWVPYYGATNPCELNCVPSGENFFYRQRPAVVDGTQCYVGRSDICVDGVCRTLNHGEFMGLDEDPNSVHTAAPIANAIAIGPQPRETLTYVYKTGVYGECSASCNGGMQYRSVECWVQDSLNPRVVEDTHCITHRLQRPASQQACNMQPCAEYSVSSFSVCSVTCGEGHQTREVVCVGPRGTHLGDHACRGQVRPASTQTCRRPACHTRISWHVTEYSLCTRSCGGGTRERRVSCFDTDLNPYPEDRCGLASKPASVESCNNQACSSPQSVPSVQNPRTQDSVVRGFVPHVPSGGSSVSVTQVNTISERYPPVIGPYCAQSTHGCCPDGNTPASGPRYQGCPQEDCVRSRYGCCPDGNTAATGPRYQGCPPEDCVRTRYGCCLDGVTPAQGFGRVGCPEYQTRVEHPASSPVSPSTHVCSLTRDEGPCDAWMVRFFYDSSRGRCTEFWYGSCHGNANNFLTLDECQRKCGYGVSQPSTRDPQRRMLA